MADSPSPLTRTAVRAVVVSLVIDLLAFTLPLPLFPHLIQAYIQQDTITPKKTSLLQYLLRGLASARHTLTASQATKRSTQQEARLDVVILGGVLASIFSFCQYLVSPYIGSLSDRLGRRRTLLLTLLGNILSASLWLFASNFELYCLSRLVGGLSEGNVQLALLIISDVTTPEQRPRSLALVGMCFALAFTFGPPLGAYLVRHVSVWKEWNPPSNALSQYSLPALVTVLLLVLETLYVYIALPETLPAQKPSYKNDSTPHVNRGSATSRFRKLKHLMMAFSFIFSGTEFTLCFLTFDVFAYNNAQNGMLLGFVGIMSSLAQGGVVRRRGNKPEKLVASGLRSCWISLICLAGIPFTTEQNSIPKALLWAAALCIAWSSATVVNSLNALASIECDASSDKGRLLGGFRSAGQLGRACGPLALTSMYWLLGPSVTYGFAATVMLAVSVSAQTLLRNIPKTLKQK